MHEATWIFGSVKSLGLAPNTTIIAQKQQVQVLTINFLHHLEIYWNYILSIIWVHTVDPF